MSTFISSSLYEKLNIMKRLTQVKVRGISQGLKNISSCCDLTIYSSNSNFKIKMCCLIIPKISFQLPQFSFSTSNWNIPNDLKLADPHFHEPSNIDILIGCEYVWEM